MGWLSDHPAYTAPDTPARQIAAYVKSPEMQATWAPSENVALAMFEIVSRNKAIPLRLPTGQPAWSVVKNKLDEVAKELEEIKELSFSVDDGSLNKSAAFLADHF